MNRKNTSLRSLMLALGAFLIAASLGGCGRSESSPNAESARNQVRMVPVSVEAVTPSPMKDILVLYKI